MCRFLVFSLGKGLFLNGRNFPNFAFVTLKCCWPFAEKLASGSTSEVFGSALGVLATQTSLNVNAQIRSPFPDLQACGTSISNVVGGDSVTFKSTRNMVGLLLEVTRLTKLGSNLGQTNVGSLHSSLVRFKDTNQTGWSRYCKMRICSFGNLGAVAQVRRNANWSATSMADGGWPGSTASTFPTPIGPWYVSGSNDNNSLFVQTVKPITWYVCMVLGNVTIACMRQFGLAEGWHRLLAFITNPNEICGVLSIARTRWQQVDLLKIQMMQKVMLLWTCKLSHSLTLNLTPVKQT